MTECSFCGKNFIAGRGMLFVFISGKTANFCSSKCEKNATQLKRKPRATRWTKESRAQKELHKKEHKAKQ